MTTPTKPDCCEAMRWILAKDDLVSFASSERVGGEDCDGVCAFRPTAATWIATTYDNHDGAVAWTFTRIRYCPWCGACVDEREKL